MNWGRLFLGTVIIALGTLWLLDNSDVLDAGEVISTWWPVVVILAGVLTFAANRRHWAVALILVLVGATMLLTTFDVVDLGDIVIPVVVILVGIFIVLGRGGMGSSTETGDRVSTFNVFSGSEMASRSDRFEGGNISALFGGVGLDLRNATPAPGATIDVFAAFGGVEIKVPQGWNVNLKGFPIFGGFDNITAKEALDSQAPTLDVSATVLFGGVEVSH